MDPVTHQILMVGTVMVSELSVIFNRLDTPRDPRFYADEVYVKWWQGSPFEECVLGRRNIKTVEI